MKPEPLKPAEYWRLQEEIDVLKSEIEQLRKQCERLKTEAGNAAMSQRLLADENADLRRQLEESRGIILSGNAAIQRQITLTAELTRQLAAKDEALNASAPDGYKCTDCTIDREPCPTCYAAWWRKRHPYVLLVEPTLIKHSEAK